MVGSSGRRYVSRGAARAIHRRFIGVGQGCALTIHSSRTRFFAWLKCVVVPLPQLTDQQVAGRLNSSVRPRTSHDLSNPHFCRVRKFPGGRWHRRLEHLPHLNASASSGRRFSRRSPRGFLRHVLGTCRACGLRNRSAFSAALQKRLAHAADSVGSGGGTRASARSVMGPRGGGLNREVQFP